MRIGVYVGSFDPVHMDHVRVVNCLLDNNYVDKIIVVPTGNYWDKQKIIDVKYRIEMWEFYQSDRIIIDRELNDLPYTYMVLDRLHDRYRDDSLYLIIGADNIVNFHLWKEIDKILENKILILPRNDIDYLKYINEYENKDNFIVVDNFSSLNIASSDIRGLIRMGKYDELIKYLDIEIIDYIRKNRLYI